MELKLTKATFRRLVWLQLFSFIPAIGIVIYELNDPRWLGFDASFRQLALKIFGDPVEVHIGVIIVSGLGLLANFIAMIGLLSFQWWSRSVFAVTTIIGIPIWILVSGRVGYSSNITTVLDMIVTLINGGVLLMAYGRGLGTEWFARKGVIESDGK